jgi:hypothetical protein
MNQGQGWIIGAKRPLSQTLWCSRREFARNSRFSPIPERAGAVAASIVSVGDSPDGQTVVLATEDDDDVRLWNLAEIL